MITPPPLQNSAILPGTKPKIIAKETLDDEFFLKLDPKTLFTDEFTPTPLKVINLQHFPQKESTQDAGSGSQELIINQEKAVPEAKTEAVTTQNNTTSAVTSHQNPFRSLCLIPLE